MWFDQREDEKDTGRWICVGSGFLFHREEGLLVKRASGKRSYT